jgi:putative transcriptional regulator
MEPMKKKSDLTKLLILREIVIEQPKDQRSIARNIGITPQAVSDYLKTMEEENLVNLSGKSPAATVDGVESLQRNLLRIKTYIDGTIERLDIIRSIDAIAYDKVDRENIVTLFMHEGLLYCKNGGSGPSTGYADNDGEKGEIIMISGLTGVIKVPDAVHVVVEITPARQGGGASKIPKEVMEKIVDECPGGGQHRVAVLDQEAASLLIRSRIGCDLEMPSAPTIRRTLERGISIVTFGTPHSISRILSAQELAPEDLDICRLNLSDIN